jgi:hypothetical protein
MDNTEEYFLREKERLLKTYKCKTIDEVIQYFEEVLEGKSIYNPERP